MQYEGAFKSHDGLELFERGWEPRSLARACVVHLHGYGEHCSRYAEMARVLNGAGFSVHTYDQRGFGRSPGKRGYINDFDVLLTDLDTFLAHVKPRIADRPWFLMGHSIGGQTDAPHGLTMAAVGPAYMATTWDADIVRYAEVTRLLGYAKPGLSDQELARRSPEALAEVLQKFGCRVRMRDLGVKEDMIEAMTDSAFKTMSGCLNCSLKTLSRADVVKMYRDSL